VSCVNEEPSACYRRRRCLLWRESPCRLKGCCRFSRSQFQIPPVFCNERVNNGRVPFPPLNRLLFHERGGRGPTSVSAAAKHFRRGLENLNLVGFWGRGGGARRDRSWYRENVFIWRERERRIALAGWRKGRKSFTVI